MLESASALANDKRDCGGGELIMNENSPYRPIGEKLFDRFREQEYADLYSPEGKLGISPVVQAFVTVFQFMEKLPDR